MGAGSKLVFIIPIQSESLRELQTGAQSSSSLKIISSSISSKPSALRHDPHCITVLMRVPKDQIRATYLGKSRICHYKNRCSLGMTPLRACRP